MKKYILFASVFSAVLMLPSQRAAAVPFSNGDVFAAVGNGTVDEYSNAGVFIQHLIDGQGGFTTGMAFDAAGNLYVTNFSAGTVSKFNKDGTLNTGAFVSPGNSPESIVFDKLGNFTVGSTSGGINQYTGAGVFIKNIGVGTDWHDLAADQHTIYWDNEQTTIHTVDSITGLSGPDFGTTTGSNAYALRLLSGGGLLVGAGTEIDRMNAAGVVTKSDYASQNLLTDGGWFALNLDPNGTSFWSGSFNTEKFYKFDITTGALQTTVDSTGATPGSRLFGLAVAGEITQGAPPPAVPEPATLTLLGLGIAGMAGYGWRRRKLAVI